MTKRELLRSTTAPSLPLDGTLTYEKLLVALAGEDILSKTGTEQFKGNKFSVDQSPPIKRPKP